ncbi:MAG: hypothetical protein IPK16_32815 [Anaerolineales bacterium]|nr:hypothetical protein [Anaerolineales bacterium]
MRHPITRHFVTFLSIVALLVLSLFFLGAGVASANPGSPEVPDPTTEDPDGNPFTSAGRVFMPQLGADMRGLPGDTQMGSATSSVNLCLGSNIVNYRLVYGTLPGNVPEDNVPAGVFQANVNGVSQYAFCTDIRNGISLGTCYSNSTLGVPDPKVACTMEYYPPAAGLGNDEAAARQSAVWHFSDGFVLSSPAELLPRTNAIIQDIEAKYANGLCFGAAPRIEVEPASAVNFLETPGVYSAHTFTISLHSGLTPLVGAQVLMTTTLGQLQVGDGAWGVTTSGQTDANGDVVFTIRHNQEGVAQISATSTVVLPAGTRIDPGPTIQKIVLNGTESYPLAVSATKEWVKGDKIVVKKFHDRNRNGIIDAGDSADHWSVRYRELPTGAFTTWKSLALMAADLAVKRGELRSVRSDDRFGLVWRRPGLPADPGGGTAAFGSIAVARFVGQQVP